MAVSRSQAAGKSAATTCPGPRRIEIVSAIVRDDLPIDEAAVRALATPLTSAEDLEQLIAMAIAELHGLHEGTLARFRLRPSELRRWQGRKP
jgi:hypothetical protein